MNAKNAAGRLAIACVALAVWLGAAATGALAQGSRKDDIVLGPTGHPVAGATVRVCQPQATGTPCLPLATIYTDATLTVAAPNPFQSDGIGNYHFYAPAGRYLIQISALQISGTITQPDTILPPDLSSSGAGNDISAFSLALGGNLTVAGNATIDGTLTAANFNPGALSPPSLQVQGNMCASGPRPYIDVTCPPYNAVGDGAVLNAQNGSIASGTNSFTVSGTPAAGWHAGMGITIFGAGASGGSLVAKVGSVAGPVFTLVDNSGNPVNAGTTVTGGSFQDDDTLAIQAAIGAYCNNRTNSNGGSIFFPPGNYVYTHAQNPSSSPTFTLCQDIHLLGGNSAVHNGAQFSHAPAASILVSNGSSPNAHPDFSVGAGIASQAPNVTLENLSITGYNNAVFDPPNSVDLTLKNTNLSVGYTGLAGNSALHISDSYWIFIEGGSLNTLDTRVPALLATADACTGCTTNVGLVYMDGTRIVTGNIQYAQNAAINSGFSGNWVLANVSSESQTSDFLTITNPSGSQLIFGPIRLSNVLVADNSDPNAVLINFNGGAGDASILSGVHIAQSSAPGPDAVVMTQGTLNQYYAEGCGIVACSTLAVDASGNLVASGVTSNQNGFDITDDPTDLTRLRTDPRVLGGTATGPAIRVTPTGTNRATYGLDVANGLMFAAPTANGWNSQIYQNSGGTIPNISVAFAQNYPPANVAGTASGTGGTLPAGTYYIYGASDTQAGDNCSTTAYLSAPSNIAGPFTLTGTTSSIALTWTAAPAGITPAQGYCFFLTNSPQITKFANRMNSTGFVSGVSSTSATVTSQTGFIAYVFPTSQMVNVDSIAPSGATFNSVTTSTGPALTTQNTTPASNTGSLAAPIEIGWMNCTQASCANAYTAVASAPATTLYELKAAVACSASAASATAALSIQYTDPSGTVQTIAPAGAACAALGPASVEEIVQPVVALAGTNIQYKVVTAASPSYLARVAIHQEGTN